MPTSVDKGEELANKSRNAAEDTADDLRRQMRDLKHETEQKLDKMAHQLRSYGSGMARETQSQIREHPLSSVGGAFAAGLVLGCLMASLGGTSRR